MYRVEQLKKIIGYVEKIPNLHPSSLSFIKIDSIPNTELKFSLENEQKELKRKLWKLLPKKVISSKKQIIGKEELSDEELISLLKLYDEKYNDAKSGLDVFEAQSEARGVTQEVFRQIVISKGDEFKLIEKKINDVIEMVRSEIENKINSSVSKKEIVNIGELIEKIDNFSIRTTLEEILLILKEEK